MIRKLMASVVLAASLVLAGGSAGYADPPVDDPNCTFEKGTTTCTETTRTYENVPTDERCDVYSNNELDGYIVEVYVVETTTTTTYKGRHTHLEPESTTVTEERYLLDSYCY